LAHTGETSVVPDNEHIDSDVQFGVTRALLGDFVRHDEPSAGAVVFARPAILSWSEARRGVPSRRSAPRRWREARTHPRCRRFAPVQN